MIAVRHPRIWGGVLIGIILLLVMVFRHCYGDVNDPKTAFRIDEMEVSYGQPEIETDGIMLTVEKPVVNKYFSEDYNMDVIRYKIPFEAHNISEDEDFDLDETNLQIVSGGSVHLGWPFDAYDSDDKRDTNWGMLKPGETTRGYWLIEAVIEDFPAEVYYDYDLYFLQHEGDVLFKYRFTEN